MFRLAVVLLLSASLGHGMPVLQLPDAGSQLRRAGGRPKLCQLLMLTLGSALMVGAAAARGFFTDDMKGDEIVRGVDHVDALPVTQDAGRALFADGESATAFEFTLGKDEPPTLYVFKKNGMQRTAATMFNQYMADQEQDAAAKEKWLKSPPGIRASLEGIRLERDAAHPDQVTIYLRSGGKEAPLPEKVSAASLEAGKAVNVKMADDPREIPNVGTAKVSGEIQLRYLKDKGSLFVEKASFKISATLFGIPTEDSGTFTNLVGQRK